MSGFKTTKELFKEMIKELEKENNRLNLIIKELKEKGNKDLKNACWICGDEKITKHHLEPSDKRISDGVGWIPLCRKHHDNIENIKFAIKIIDRERRPLSVKHLIHIVDSLKEIGGKTDE